VKLERLPGNAQTRAAGATMMLLRRALDIFSQLRIWDTTHNNGVLIYLLLADRDVELLADRHIGALVSTAEWHNICDGIWQCNAGGPRPNSTYLHSRYMVANSGVHYCK
jgi:uncharacterized membrane protein